MGDGWDYQKRQNDLAREFPELDTPTLVFFREGDTGAELCVVIEGRHHAIALKPGHLAALVSMGAKLLCGHIQRKR